MRTSDLIFTPGGCCLVHSTASVALVGGNSLEVRKEPAEEEGESIYVLAIRMADGRLFIGSEAIPSGVTIGVDEADADRIISQLVGAQ